MNSTDSLLVFASVLTLHRRATCCPVLRLRPDQLNCASTLFESMWGVRAAGALQAPMHGSNSISQAACTITVATRQAHGARLQS